RELRDKKAKVREVYKNVESITDFKVLKHPDLVPLTRKYAFALEYLEDLTRTLTMERHSLALDSIEEVVVHLEKEDKLKFMTLISEYSK
ncbi:hypothetical protein KI387_030073, partial [Taxus chinensis]